MPTPRREKILELAKELFFKDNPNATTPEKDELVESGYHHTARNQLMRNDTAFEAYLEEQAAQNGYRLVTEEEHSKLVELERTKEKLRNEKKRAKQLEAKLEKTKSEKQNEETKTQEILPFDLEEALRSGVYLCGTTGSGKSDIGMYAASLLMKHHVTVIVFDGSQDWLNRSSISCYQTLRSTYIARIPHNSVIFDISLLSIPQQQNLVERFCRLLMKHQAETPEEQRRQYFLVFEEAHTYFPEGCMRAKRLQNTVKMITQGRNYRVRFMAITQFSSLIDKQAMRYMKQRYFGYSDEPNDMAYLKGFLGKDVDQLNTLEAGQFLYYRKGKVRNIQIKPFETTTQPIQIEMPQGLPEQQQTKKKTQHNEIAISSIVLLLIWLVILWIALK